MKQKLQNLLFFFLLGTMGANAQGPVITADSINPIIGANFKWQLTSVSSVNPPDSGGANKIWDYSNLKDSASLRFSLVSPKGLLFADSFPTANIAEVYYVDTFKFIEYDKFSSSQWGVLANLPNVNNPNSIEIDFNVPYKNLMVYPMSFKDLYTDSILKEMSYFDGSVNSYPTIHKQYDTLYADGYGTLKLPNATYTNVLRIHSMISYGSQSYLFFSNGVHWPLLVLNPKGVIYNGGQDITSWSAQYYKGTILPLQISSFTAAWQNKTPHLQWSATNTENTKQFNIQRSTDSKNFVTVGQVGINGGTAYHYQDNTAPNTTVYYRLQQVDKNGAAFYSSTARLTVNSLPLTVFPNPAKGAIHLTIPATSQAQVFIYDIAGKLVYQNKNYNSTNTIATDTWSKGTYTIRLKDNDGWKVSSFEKE